LATGAILGSPYPDVLERGTPMSIAFAPQPPSTIEEKPALQLVEEPKLYTVEEFMELPDEGNRYELVEGVLVEIGQPGEEHGRIGNKLSFELNLHARDKNSGSVYVTTGFRLAPKTVRAPDVAFIKAENPIVRSREAITTPPDLAVEVISPNDKWSDMVEKVREYQAAGVGLIWLVDPYSPCVMIYHQSDILPTFSGIDMELDGEKVVPGFKFAVKSLFE
jgi:Uma2 family endonuclease